jgi:hypothetical protein
VSKAFSIPKNTPAVNILFWNFGWCDLPASHIEVSYCDLLESQTDLQLVSFFPQCFWIVLKTSFSNSLVVDKRLIGCKFWRNLGPLPGFGRVMISASFQGARKSPSSRQWLNKCIKCTRGIPGRCRRHSFGMPFKLHVVPNFKDCTSQGQNITRMSSSMIASKASTWVATCRLWS